MIRSKLWFYIAVLACTLTLCLSSARAQVTTADVVGTVSDSSGGVLPGATVTITNTGTSISQTTTSNASGDYVFNLLQVGSYSVRVEAKGFKSYVAPNISLSSGDRTRVDATLQVGDVSQTVEVSGSVAPALQTDTATVGSLVTSQAVEDIPLNGRNVIMLVQLAPGVNQGSPNDLMSGSRPDDRRSTTAYSANGQTDSVNMNMVDGMDNQDPIIATTLIRPSIDAIQEVNVSTTVYDASATRSAGAVVDIITKSGSNQLHGSLYEFFRNAVLNTNPNHAFPSGYCPSGSTTCTPGVLQYTPVLSKPGFQQNQYGGSVGGPIRKDKTFFFVDFEQLKKALGLELLSTVPTACERGAVACNGVQQLGNFTDTNLISQFGGSSGPGGPGPVIPLNAITPMGLAYFSMFPLPNAQGLQNNYSSNPKYSQDSTTFDFRIDHHFSEKDTLFARYSFNDVTTLVPGAFPIVTVSQADVPAALLAAQPGFTLPTVTLNPGAAPYAGQNNFPGPSLVRAQGILLSYVHVFTPNVLLNLKAGWSRLGDHVNNLNQGLNGGQKLGFPCNASLCTNYGPPQASGVPEAAFPQPQAVSYTNYTDIGDSYAIPILYIDNIFQYNSNLTWNKGNHSLRFGATLIRRREAQGQSFEPTGLFEFDGGYTGVIGGDLLEGLPGGTGAASTGTLRNYAVVVPNERQWQPGVFFQDDWRAKHWLTLNLGARYDIFAPLTEKYGRISNFGPNVGLMVSPALGGANQSGPTAGILTDYKDWAPRIGFAASLKHGMVLRGGFGMSYFQNRAAIFRNAPFGYSFGCGPQNLAQTAATCSTTPSGGVQFANAATIHYGPPAGANSETNNGTTSPAYVGTGGSLFAAGAPIPNLNILPVLPPATCPLGSSPTSVGCTQAGGNLYPTVSTSATWPHQPIPYLEQFSLQLQKAIKQNVIQIGYVGELGRHNGGSIPFSTINNYTVTSNPLALTYPWLSKNTVSETAPLNTTSYHSLQVNLVRRFANGLTLNVNYAWAHALQNGQGICKAVYSPAHFGYGPAGSPKFINPCFYDNLKNTASPFTETSLTDGPGMIGNTQYDVPNHLAGTINYQLPFGKSAEGIKAALIKGWAVNASGYWQSGLDFNITNGAPLGSGIEGGLDQVCSGKLPHPTLVQWLNPACFLQPTIHTFGDEDQAQGRGPQQRNLDFSFFKEFSLNEKLRMQFRTEVFNLMNIVNYAQPGGASGNGLGSVAIPGFSASGVGIPQAVSTALLPGAITALNPNNNSRQIQFGLKFLF